VLQFKEVSTCEKEDSVAHIPRVPVPDLGDVYFNMQPRFLTISENLKQHYAFDGEGRFMLGFLGGVNYQRGLNSDILEKIAAGPGERARRALSDDEKRHLVDDVLARVQRIRQHLPDDIDAAITARLDCILTWDFERLQAEQAMFHSIYTPIGILPPDQYLAVVVQATEGCSWNRCTFCTFYRNQKFRVKSAEEFRAHVRQVRAFFGDSLSLRKSVFLADANALIISQTRLLEHLQIIREELPLDDTAPDTGHTLKGIYAFLDIYGAERKSLDDFRAMHSHGLRRIYIGLETGDSEIFQMLNKPGSPQECIEAVQTIKAAGIDVGIILLAGVGGASLAEQHIEHSLSVLRAMRLGASDIVYISPLVVSDDTPYMQVMQERGIAGLSKPEMFEQVAHFKRELRSSLRDGPKVTLYNIEEFVY
jgi:hypothetical protein